MYASPQMVVREVTVRRLDESLGVHRVVDTADIALIIPVDDDRLHLVEQHRHPVSGRRWGVPSGSLEPDRDVDPAAVAVREVGQETRPVARHLAALGTIEISPSTLTQRCSVFLAIDPAQDVPQHELEEQDMRVGLVHPVRGGPNDPRRRPH